MFAFDLLCVEFADGVGRGREVAGIDSRRIGVKVHQTKRLEQLLQLSEDLIRPAPEHLGQDDAGQMINRVPQPALVGFAPHATPHLLDLRRLHAAHFDPDRVGTTPLDDAFVDRRERGRFFLTP